ncbi:3,4-dihydroxy-2-butanone-4-phosphate synthase [Haloplanus salinus]|jgi:3,4-dihydroxy 2-butanone 4-phosphate synthase|uniref:3,4-dihydroxy-2-butanone 4-phosphate synthase n=1 Tax=Haloplanus salinus TaxID=1126245 RepID=A0A368N9P7_9EURY|nr:3,4-dihydroxy-2-butanone-4-phosphate synthase [Haloplanus salinus]RCU46860.1 3,4-dihydroxy-2-butanone-4-phosphate synthase [Haloplanus salinus]
MHGESTGTLERAVAAFRGGDPVLVHDADDREGETDLLYPASAVTPAAVARLRNDGGGLIFVALPAAVADRFDLPFLHESVDHPANDYTDLGYDARPSFSLTVNHRDGFTGVTDDDRALTIRRLGEVSDDDAVGVDAFADEFRTPGHVHLLRGASGLLDERRGHTELGLALAREAGVAPAVAGCEMLDDETGGALSTVDAEAYARRHDLPFVEGAALIRALE